MTDRDQNRDASPSVLLVAPDLSTGGGANRVATNLSGLLAQDLGCHVTLVSARSSRRPTYPVPDGVHLELAASERVGLFAYFLELLKLRRRRPDYAMGFWTHDNILLALAFLFSRTRLILCEHFPHFAQPRHVGLMRRVLYPVAWRVTVLNDTEYRYYHRFLNNVQLVPNPLPPVRDSRSRADEKLVIGVGHLTPLKGFLDLVDAWSKADLAREGWKLTIIGEGEQRSAIEDKIRRQGIEGIEIVPPTADIAGWYDRARILVSTAKIEVFSLVIAEATKHGVVPLAYAADGPSYLLEDFPELLVECGDVDGLASKLRRLAKERELSLLAKRVARSLDRRMSPVLVRKIWRTLISSV